MKTPILVDRLLKWGGFAMGLSIVLATVLTLSGAPFAGMLTFNQPDGTVVELMAKGDEFSSILETLDGYTVVIDDSSLAYCYAQLSGDGNALVSTGVWVGEGDPTSLGMPTHLRMDAKALSQQVALERGQWAAASGIDARWQKAKTLARSSLTSVSGTSSVAPSTPTTGTVIGLCLLVDFDDLHGTISQSEVGRFCNDDHYTGFGNNGSVKSYFSDNSNGRLTYSNIVTAYVRIPNSLHPRSYYDNPTRRLNVQANYLIRDAVAVLKARPDFQTQILPQLNALTTDADNYVIALNVFYAGACNSPPSRGLWPHTWGLASLTDAELLQMSLGGMWLYNYQISPMGSQLELGGFCHENGHLLCSFPDIYDIDYDSFGGAGELCLMDMGWPPLNPPQICAYLKAAAGWGTVTEIPASGRMTGTLNASPGPNFNHFYRYSRPGVPTEYFILENRQQTGRDSGSPVSGVAVWHIDELGIANDQSLTPNSMHANYEVTLVQADNQWHFERYVNSADVCDYFYLGNTALAYSNGFSDSSTPNAHWWDGTPSGLDIRYFSASAETMTFMVGAGDVYQPIEAESGVLVSPMARFSDAQASQNQYIASPTASAGSVSFAFTVPVAGSYWVWCRGSAANSNQNSIMVSMDGGAGDVYDLPLSTVASPWIWSRINGQAGSGVPGTLNPRVFTLAAGSHTLSFSGLEANVKLDKLLITSDNGLNMSDAQVAILVQPHNQQVMPNGDATFSVVAWSPAPMSYQWRFKGANLVGQTSAKLKLSHFTTNQAGAYSVLVSNVLGVAVSADALALPSPAQVYAWGWDSFRQAEPPPQSMTPIALSGGGFHNLALNYDGTVVAWGINNCNQTSVPNGLTGVIGISGGRRHSLAVCANGRVVGWGTNEFGQLNNPANLTNAISVAAGYSHSIALTADGRVVGWGNNSYGQSASLTSGGFAAISAKGNHNLALRAAGTVVAWGDNSYGQTNVPAGLTGVVAVAAGWGHSLALKSNGTVVAWGDAAYGQTSVPSGLTNVVAIAAGYIHSAALLANGRLSLWGDNTYGQTNVPSGATNVVMMDAGGYHTLLWTGDATPSHRLFNEVKMQNAFQFYMPTRPGKTYVLEYKNALSQTGWTKLTNFIGNGSVRLGTDNPLTSPQRFYRLREY